VGGEYLKLRFVYAVLLGLLTFEAIIRVVLSAWFNLSGGYDYLWWVGVAAVVFLWTVHVPVWAVISQKPEPTKWIFQTYRANLMWFVAVGILLAFAWLKADNVAKIKNAIPLMVPYYADPFFIAADRAIFFTDPWRITHAVIPEIGTRALDAVYALWHPIQVGFGCWMIFTRNLQLQVKGLLSYTIAWLLLGGVVATLFSSVGPPFYEHFYGDPYFRPLLADLDGAEAARGGFTLLIEWYQMGTFGSGISAFPSMHVSVAVWEALVVSMAFRNRWLTAAAWTWAAVIMLGSVHLGWHYAVDGLFSIVATVAIWRMTGRLIERLSTPRESSSGHRVAAV
jgi:hypothetical protein